MLLRATEWHIRTANVLPVRHEPGPLSDRARPKGFAELRVVTQRHAGCDGQLFFAADLDGELDAAFYELPDADFEADFEGALLGVPAPPPSLASATAATASLIAFWASLFRVSALGVFSPARPAPL